MTENIKYNLENMQETEYHKYIIPQSEYELTFSRSSGPGGQSVNKTESRVTVRWNLESSSLNDTQKDLVRDRLFSRLTDEGDLILSEQSNRSQMQNREKVIKRLNQIVNEALIPEKERVATRPSKKAKEKRLESKKRQSQKKQLRQTPEW